MFIDSSAIVAVMTTEDDELQFVERMALADKRVINSAVYWEVAVNLAKKRGLTVANAKLDLNDFLSRLDIEIVSIPPEAASVAVDAYDRFGKGRHPAALNFGDCLSYASAKVLNQPLLFKGNDFALTDLTVV